MVEKLLRCKQCNQVIPLYGEFIDCDDETHLPGVIWAEEDFLRREEFWREHNGHELEELTVDFDSYVSNRPSFELIKVSLFEASNGQERFLIKRTRERLDQPAHYEIIPGKLKLSNVALEFLKEELSKQLRALNGSERLETEVIDALIRSIEEELKDLSLEAIFQEIDIVEEGETPLLLYGTFKEKHWQNIIQRLQNYLSSGDIMCLLDFLEKNKLLKEITPLIIRQEISITNN